MPPKRPLPLTILILLLALGVAKALYTVTFRRAELLAALPGMTPALFAGYLASVAGIVASLAGLWLMKRWAGWLVVAVSVATLAFDALARAPREHAIAATLSCVLLLAALWPVRGWFFGSLPHANRAKQRHERPGESPSSTSGRSNHTTMRTESYPGDPGPP